MKQLKPMSQDDKVSIRWCLYVVLFLLIILVIALCTIGRMVMGYEVAEIFESHQNADWEVNLEWANEFESKWDDSLDYPEEIDIKEDIRLL